MPFHAESPRELEALTPGSRIEFQLKVSRNASSVTHIRVQSTAITGVELPKPVDKIAIGQPLPDFTLTDQTGRSVSLAQFRGQVVALDFIYTRCPLPDVCPRLSANFATLQRRFRGRNVMLLSVTVDPDYDTPAVIAAYGRRWAADPAMWRMLTGDIAPLAAALGEVYWTDEGSIGHNSTTTILDRTGRIAAVVEGSNYRIDQLQHLIAQELEKRQ